MTGQRKIQVLFTGYAPVHFACFRPLYERLRALPWVEVRVSGGLRTKTPDGHQYDEQGLYGPFNIPAESIIPTESLAEHACDVLFAANTKMIAPREVGHRVQIFHGISFRNKAVRSDNAGADHYFVIGPYMMRRFVESHILAESDPRAVPTGFMKTDALLDGSLSRDTTLAAYGMNVERPTLLYAPTGQKHNSLETMGEDAIKRLVEADRFNVLIKPHDHPKNAGINWFKKLAPYESDHLRVVRELDVIPLLHAADLLITDASSVSSEYALLNRPMVFLDVPKLIKRARKANESALDLDTWGRKCGPIIKKPAALVDAIEDELNTGEERAFVRQAMARDLFYNPGCATDAAVEWFTDAFAPSSTQSAVASTESMVLADPDT